MGEKPSRGEKAVMKHTKVKPPEDPVLRGIITGIAGERGYEIAKEFVGREAIAEEVAKRVGTHVNVVRKMLYNLYENRIANYRRAMDKHSGWYVYYWRIDPGRAREYFENNKRMLLRKLEGRLEAERSTNFFSCKNEDPKLPFELAMENDFKCPRCGSRLEPYDNSNVVVVLERRIESLRQQLIQNKRLVAYGTS